MKRALAFVCAVLTIAAIVGAPAFVIYRRIEPASLRSWIARVERPGWRLLHSAETDTHWFAVFDAGDDRLAFCWRDRGKEPRSYQSSLTVTDAAGKDVEDSSRRTQFVDRDVWIVVGEYGIVDGHSHPIRPGHAGHSSVIAVLSKPDDVSLPEASLDFAVLYDVAAHVDERAEPGLYASIARALNPDGRLLVVDPGSCLASFGRGGTAGLLERLDGYGLALEDASRALSPEKRESRLRSEGLIFRRRLP